MLKNNKGVSDMAKKKTILDFYKMKQAGEQVTFCSLYDAPFASYAEQAGIDLILVGDSVGMRCTDWTAPRR